MDVKLNQIKTNEEKIDQTKKAKLAVMASIIRVCLASDQLDIRERRKTRAWGENFALDVLLNITGVSGEC